MFEFDGAIDMRIEVLFISDKCDVIWKIKRQLHFKTLSEYLKNTGVTGIRDRPAIVFSL